MTSDTIMFAGLAFSSGRKPLTFARLDDDLRIQTLEKWDSSTTLSYLQESETSLLGINIPSTQSGQKLYTDLTKKLAQAGFQPFSPKNQPKQWVVTNAQDCFRILSGHHLLPRRSLEGRLQRSAILYEHGVHLKDPVEMFEEITRFKLIQGILALDELPSSNELDALVAAYLAWLSLNRPGRIAPKGELVLPAEE